MTNNIGDLVRLELSMLKRVGDKVPKLIPLPVSITYVHLWVKIIKFFFVMTLQFNNVNKYDSPKQPVGHECGYYVMRYMKEIIDDETLGFTSKISIIVWRKHWFEY